MLWGKICWVFFLNKTNFFAIMRERRGNITELQQIKTKVLQKELKLHMASTSWLERKENLNNRSKQS